MKRLSPLLRIFLVLCICLSMLSLLPVRLVRAAVIPVISLADSGPGTLRNAIASAAAGDTITFDPSLAGGMITLSSQIVLDKDLTIDGSGLSPHVQISGGDVTRVFYVNSGVTVSITELDIVHGKATDGAGIYNLGVLTITNSKLSYNSGSNEGGGIYNNKGTLALTNSIFLENTTAIHGGGIYNSEGTMNVADSIFSGNISNAGSGAGIINYYGILTVIDSVFTENQARTTEAGNGAGIALMEGALQRSPEVRSSETSVLIAGELSTTQAAR